MASELKILAQSVPAATTLIDFYTVPASTTTVVSSITVCNQAAAPTTFRISLAVDGTADSAEQYIYYDLPINGNDTFVATIGVTMGDTDVMRVYAGANTLSFNAFGQEVTA